MPCNHPPAPGQARTGRTTAALWLISDIAIAFISPKELPHFLIALGFVPAAIIGIVLHWQRFQRRHERLPLPSAKRG